MRIFTKRLLAVLLTMLTLTTAVPVGVSSVSAENTTEFAGGNGTAENPYLVETATHLDNVRFYLDAHFRMIADIQFTTADFEEGGDFYDGVHGWEPIGTESTPFEGQFDGDSHTITGLLCHQNGEGKIYAGLFGYSTGTIQNLGLLGGNISASSTPTSTSNYSSDASYAGGIAGYNSGMISNCYNMGSVSATTSTDDPAFSCAGGIAGYNAYGGLIGNCYNMGGVSAASTSTYTSSVNQSYSYASGIVGYNSGMIGNCYNMGSVSSVFTTPYSSVSSHSYAGGIAGYNSGTISNCYNIGSVSSAFTAPYSSVSSHSYAGGIAGYNSGTINNCYNIGSVSAAFSFTASSSPSYAGGIAGYNSDKGTFSNCYYWEATHNGVCVGSDTTTRCTFEQLKSQETFVGFDFDTVWELVEGNAYPFPTLQTVPHGGEDGIENTTEFAGGTGTLYNPYRIANKAHLNNVRKYLDAHFLMVTDIVFTEADFTEGGAFYNDGQGWEPIGTDSSKPFFGSFDANGHTVTGLYCYLSGSGVQYAGLFGYNQGFIQNLGLVDGNISVKAARSCAGSVSGSNSGTISNCYNTGSVSATTTSPTFSYAGGIAGYNSGIIGSCYNTGGVSATTTASGDCNSYAGGIAGQGNADNCYNTGSVSAVNSASGSYYYCYSYAGGITGQGSAYNCYNTGHVTAENTFSYHSWVYVGGIAGRGSAVNCYYLVDVVNTGEGTQCTMRQLQRQSTFIGFDFDAIWEIDDYREYAYPQLKMNRQERIQSIDLLTPPTNNQVVEGCQPDLSGATVKITYTDGKTVSVDATLQMLAELDVNRTGMQAIHFAYGGQKTEETVNIEVIPRAITSISVSALPEKTTYVQGQTVNPDGGILTIYYNDATSETVTLDKAQLSYTTDQPGTVIATVEYQGHTTTFTIEVIERKVQSLSLVKPQKLSYIEGQSLDLTGMKVTAVYNDGTSEIIEDFTYEGYQPTIGTHTVTVTYEECKVEFTVSVVAKKMIGIQVTKLPTKLTYLEGEVFDPAGMVVTAQYNNGTSETIEEYNVSGYDSAPGSKIIRVEYQGKSVTFTVNVRARSLESIEITKQPDKTEYIEGQELDTDGLVVTAHYDNGTSEPVTGYSTAGYTGEIGMQTVVVTYQGKTASFSVRVIARIVTGLEIQHLPNKTDYLEGDEFEPDGLVVILIYNDGSTEETNDYTLTGYSSLPGLKTISVMCEGQTAQFQVTVQAKTLTHITITYPEKLNYYVNEEFVPDGLTVTAHYDNGKAVELDEEEYALNGFDSKAPGNKTITVTYEGKTQTFSVSVMERPTPEASYSISSDRGRVGDTVSVTVSVKRNPGIAGFRHTLQFDPAVLKFVSVEGKEILQPGNLVVNEEQAGSGQITLVWFNPTDLEADGELYTLTFEILEGAAEGSSDVTLSFEDKDNQNAAGEYVFFQVKSGGVEVVDYILGDLTGDKTLGMKDVLLLAQVVSGQDIELTEKQRLAADVNEDDEIDLSDVILLSQWLLDAPIRNKG